MRGKYGRRKEEVSKEAEGRSAAEKLTRQPQSPHHHTHSSTQLILHTTIRMRGVGVIYA
jgi:hypothetical protein